MATSAGQVARLLVEIPYLQAHPGVRLEAAAATFGITRDQLLADLNVAFFCGLPGGLPGDLIEVDFDAIEGEGVVHVENAEVLSKPLRLLPDEATSLLLAVLAVREVADEQSYPAIDRVVAKLSDLAGTLPTSAAVSVAAGDESVRTAINAAITQHSRVRLTYDGQARGETTYPVVDPASVEVRDGYAYLRAWSVDRDGWRSYRLDRVAAVEQTGEPAESHGEPPVNADWLADAPDHVRLKLRPEAGWVAEYYPATQIDRGPDSITLTLAVADAGWLAQLLLRLGDDVLDVTPASAAAPARAMGEAALDAYRAAGLG